MVPLALNILLVEDERIVAEDIADMLQEAGYFVIGPFADGASALQAFQETQPDLVLMDIQLQGDMDGVTLAEQINALRHVPIIYLTAQADAPTVARARATRPAAYLLKPFDDRSIVIAIDIAFGNFSAQQVAAHPAQERAAAQEQQKAAKERLGADTILCLNDILFVKQVYKFVKISRPNLLYIEADAGHSHIYTTTGKLTLRLSLSQIIDKLADPEMVRVHRSYAVRRSAVETISDHELIVNQRSIPMGDAFKDAFFSGFNVL